MCGGAGEGEVANDGVGEFSDGDCDVEDDEDDGDDVGVRLDPACAPLPDWPPHADAARSSAATTPAAGASRLGVATGAVLSSRCAVGPRGLIVVRRT